jgi:hypothetical protein
MKAGRSWVLPNPARREPTWIRPTASRPLTCASVSAKRFVRRVNPAGGAGELVEAKSGKVTYRFEFGSQCQDCRVRSVCVPSAQRHRTIVVGALHETLQQRRREQQSPEFKRRMHQRNGIEGTLSELVRGHGLRRARYKGFAKVDLQNQLVAAACNVKRWLQKLLLAAIGERFASPFVGAKAFLRLQSVRHGVLSCRGAKLTGVDLGSRKLSSFPALP